MKKNIKWDDILVKRIMDFVTISFFYKITFWFLIILKNYNFLLILNRRGNYKNTSLVLFNCQRFDKRTLQIIFYFAVNECHFTSGPIDIIAIGNRNIIQKLLEHHLLSYICNFLGRSK